MGAHRYSYMLHKGTIAPGMFVMHACDNKLCVNPDHLSLGTPRDNTQDMIAKGRKARGKYALGEDVGCSVLTADAVREIRASDKTNKELADQFGASVNAVRYARTRKTWKHIQ